MTNRRVDVVIVGSGFSGSIVSLLLNRIGLSVLLLDRDRHPRFAIGESSTPAADFVLADLARKYDLPRLLPLAQFGSLRSAYPQLGCGLKRGFSYFQHTTGQPFALRPDRSNELPFVHLNLSTNRDHGGPPLDLPAFESAVVNIQLMIRR